MNPFPIAGAQIHPPLLRADTLSRPRLNDWLDRAATGRVALVIAEAGFGKTTLLADWAVTASRLTAWYRLDPDDRDWLAFLSPSRRRGPRARPRLRPGHATR